MELLLIHEEEIWRNELAQTFEYEGIHVHAADRLEAAQRSLRDRTFDFCLISSGFGDGDVLDFHAFLDVVGGVPAMVLSAHPTPKQTVLFLEYGYEDVLTFPCDLMELRARIRSIMKRPRNDRQSRRWSELNFDSFSIDLIHRKAMAGEQSVVFSCKEFSLLLLLIRDHKRVWSREEICNELWPEDHLRTVDVYIRRIRDKFRLIQQEDLIQTKWGEGYFFRLPPRRDERDRS